MNSFTVHLFPVPHEHINTNLENLLYLILKVLKQGSLLTYVWNINWGIGSLVSVDGNRKRQKEAKVLTVGGSPLISARPGPVPLGLVHSRCSLHADGEMMEEEYEMQLRVDL